MFNYSRSEFCPNRLITHSLSFRHCTSAGMLILWIVFAHLKRLPIILLILSGNGNTIFTRKQRLQTPPLRHCPRPVSNIYHLPDAPPFSLFILFTTFKSKITNIQPMYHYGKNCIHYTVSYVHTTFLLFPPWFYTKFRYVSVEFHSSAVKSTVLVN